MPLIIEEKKGYINKLKRKSVKEGYLTSAKQLLYMGCDNIRCERCPLKRPCGSFSNKHQNYRERAIKFLEKNGYSIKVDQPFLHRKRTLVIAELFFDKDYTYVGREIAKQLYVEERFMLNDFISSGFRKFLNNESNSNIKIRFSNASLEGLIKVEVRINGSLTLVTIEEKLSILNHFSLFLKSNYHYVQEEMEL